MENITKILSTRYIKVQPAPLKIYLLIIAAGLIDISTTLIGVNLSSLIEVNVINATFDFPIGVLFWVSYFCLFTYVLTNGKFKVKSEKEELELQQVAKYIPLFLVLVAFLIPVHNLILIMGGGLI